MREPVNYCRRESGPSRERQGFVKKFVCPQNRLFPADGKCSALRDRSRGFSQPARERSVGGDRIMWYSISSSCPGSHLHGEESGSGDRHHNLPGSSVLEAHSARKIATLPDCREPEDGPRNSMLENSLIEPCKSVRLVKINRPLGARRTTVGWDTMAPSGGCDRTLRGVIWGKHRSRLGKQSGGCRRANGPLRIRGKAGMHGDKKFRGEGTRRCAGS